MATLRLFAYSNYQEYKLNRARFLDLKPAQIKKLRMISIVDAAQRTKVLDYKALMRDLEIGSLRELEDLIIDCIYNDLVSGKLDQLNQRFHVTNCAGRDLRPEDIGSALAKLEAWDAQLESAQKFIEEKVVNSSNKSILQNYERQMRQAEEVALKRDEMLKEMMGESGGKGPKKASGFGGLLAGFLNK